MFHKEKEASRLIAVKRSYLLRGCKGLVPCPPEATETKASQTPAGGIKSQRVADTPVFLTTLSQQLILQLSKRKRGAVRTFQRVLPEW